MRPSSTKSVFLALLIPLLQSSARPALAAGEPDKPWRVAYDRCQKLSNDGEYSGALEACEQAYAMNRDPGILAYIAQIQTALFHPVQAREALDRYLRSGPLEDADRKTAEAQIRYLETQIGTLLINTRRPDAEIRIDDEPMGASALAHGIQLPAGAHRLTLIADGTTLSRFVVLRGGQRMELELPGDGVISLSCADPKTRFFIDGQELDAVQATRGVSRAAGAHRVTFKGEASASAEQAITLNPDEHAAVVCTKLATEEGGHMNTRGYWVTGAGLALGVAALTTALYNGKEYDRWHAANEDLGRNISRLTFAERQQRARDNDELMSSIKTRRAVSVGLGIASGLLTAGAVALLVADSAAKGRTGSGSWLRKAAGAMSVSGTRTSGQIEWRGVW